MKKKSRNFVISSTLALFASCMLSISSTTTNAADYKNKTSAVKMIFKNQKINFKQAAEDLIKRRLPQKYSNQFIVEILDKTDNSDIFEIESINKKNHLKRYRRDRCCVSIKLVSKILL